ncbi:DNA-binding MarR family transcriptional regulator [Streptomyces sp. 2333.5]|uniref:MarR family winged helix-turn-helix transcriptional regulator n=1 Tax=unclassified Streptomyces TaxID=2593676 RepID=UPI00089917F1|nr:MULTISPECIES: MarR family winged helix-turn-helix transcriptional regulator [unclassified Streptomyces]PJI99832.1 DNA-binding MarR family transcriptional regulator [Streptomyces sp. 2333.5]PJJ05146.1 DNA-binding MarR family transcriptional regulator [Streptomyces sp. 2333.5]SEB60994.1 DNA-binding transcriptional regulator, MarR family [Streptomyces sp. 2314.4]SEC43784.1 DNA-binding transcriptional regulator, MarR family [Streptomyces sp. 2112.2]SEE69176.1 DNA-binding transcriptional regulat
MKYSHSDAELIEQPIGYWSWAAYKAVVTRTRAALAGIGTTQPQWWVLAQVARADTVKTRDEVSRLLRNYLDTGPEAMESEIDKTIAQGWITEGAGGRLGITTEGRAFYNKAAALQDELWAERHAGISGEEYLSTLKVLQRFIHNAGGRAWHH